VCMSSLHFQLLMLDYASSKFWQGGEGASWFSTGTRHRQEKQCYGSRSQPRAVYWAHCKANQVGFGDQTLIYSRFLVRDWTY
jgi:hypothetical protein